MEKLIFSIDGKNINLIGTNTTIDFVQKESPFYNDYDDKWQCIFHIEVIEVEGQRVDTNIIFNYVIHESYIGSIYEYENVELDKILRALELFQKFNLEDSKIECKGIRKI